LLFSLSSSLFLLSFSFFPPLLLIHSPRAFSRGRASSAPRLLGCTRPAPPRWLLRPALFSPPLARSTEQRRHARFDGTVIRCPLLFPSLLSCPPCHPFSRACSCFSFRAASDKRAGDAIAKGKPGKGRRRRTEPRPPLWKPFWASSTASRTEPPHLHTFGRAPAGAAHGALPNRP
jgi:hypothetical protein